MKSTSSIVSAALPRSVFIFAIPGRVRSYKSIKTEISTEPIETDFCYDDREFNTIVYVEHRQSNIEYDYVYDVDVLDSYGNYFVRVCTLPD